MWVATHQGVGERDRSFDTPGQASGSLDQARGGNADEAFEEDRTGGERSAQPGVGAGGRLDDRRLELPPVRIPPSRDVRGMAQAGEPVARLIEHEGGE